MPKQAESKSQASARHFFYIADGQTNLGFVAQDGDAFTAKDVDGRKIGVFESLKAASNAVGESYGRAGSGGSQRRGGRAYPDTMPRSRKRRKFKNAHSR